MKIIFITIILAIVCFGCFVLIEPLFYSKEEEALAPTYDDVRVMYVYGASSISEYVEYGTSYNITFEVVSSLYYIEGWYTDTNYENLYVPQELYEDIILYGNVVFY